MSALLINSTKQTPKITLDLKNLVFLIEGNSRPENADEFYQPIFSWIKENQKELGQMKKIEFNFDLFYYNSATAKQFVGLLSELYLLNNDNTTIHWYYEKDDEELLEAGKEFKEIIPLNFEFHQK